MFRHSSSANGSSSVAIGNSSATGGDSGTAVGAGSSATLSSVAYGASSDANSYATALGSESRATSSATAVGYGSVAEGLVSTTVGCESKATATATSAFGYRALADGQRAVALGSYTEANSENSIAIGSGATATGRNAIAIGASINVSGNNCVTIGASNYDVKLGGCEFENGVATIDTLYVKELHVEELSNLMGSVQTGTINATHLNTGTLDVSGSADIGNSLTVRGDAYIATTNNARTYLGVEEKSGSKKYFAMIEKRDDNVLVAREDVNPNSAPSDRRLKNVGEVFTAGLEEIKKLEVFNFVYKKDSTKTPRVGVMAQDLMKIFPNAVFKGDDGFYRIRMEDMFYALVNAVKELDKKIDLLAEKQNKVDESEKRVDKLEERLSKLEVFFEEE